MIIFSQIMFRQSDPLHKSECDREVPAVPGWYTDGNCRFEGFKDLVNLVLIVATEYTSGRWIAVYDGEITFNKFFTLLDDHFQ